VGDECAGDRPLQTTAAATRAATALQVLERAAIHERARGALTPPSRCEDFSHDPLGYVFGSGDWLAFVAVNPAPCCGVGCERSGDDAIIVGDGISARGFDDLHVGVSRLAPARRNPTGPPYCILPSQETPYPPGSYKCFSGETVRGHFLPFTLSPRQP
jgi:hypothetical protein